MTKAVIKVYPVTCRSATCGKTECNGCIHKPTLDAFKKWVKDTNAQVENPIWSPTVYTARS